MSRNAFEWHLTIRDFISTSHTYYVVRVYCEPHFIVTILAASRVVGTDTGRREPINRRDKFCGEMTFVMP